jgi:hypothetical protein
LAVALPLRRRHSFSFTVLLFFFDFFLGDSFGDFFYFFGAGFGLFWATPTCLKTLWGGGFGGFTLLIIFITLCCFALLLCCNY